MKANKVLKRLAKIEESMSDVMERYSASAPHVLEVLQEAKSAVTRAKDAVNSQASDRTQSATKMTATKAVKATKKHGSTKQELELSLIHI